LIDDQTFSLDKLPKYDWHHAVVGMRVPLLLPFAGVVVLGVPVRVGLAKGAYNEVALVCVRYVDAAFVMDR
jgi:hypothetical protein